MADSTLTLSAEADFYSWLQTLDCRGRGVLLQRGAEPDALGPIVMQELCFSYGLFFEVTDFEGWSHVCAAVRELFGGNLGLWGGCCEWRETRWKERGGSFAVLLVLNSTMLQDFWEYCWSDKSKARSDRFKLLSGDLFLFPITEVETSAVCEGSLRPKGGWMFHDVTVDYGHGDGLLFSDFLSVSRHSVADMDLDQE